MIFSELYRKSKSKHQPPLVVPAAQPSQYDADLVSKDKTKQKEAVKRYLAEKVRNDWDFQWPPAGAAPPVTAAAAAAAAPPAQPATPAVVQAAILPAPVEGEVILASDVIGPDKIPVNDQPSSADTAVPPAPAAATPTTQEAPPPPPPLVDAAAGSADPRADEPIDSGAEADSDSESVYSVVSEDPLRYRPRAEWTSDLSDDETRGPTVSPSPFRFDTPDSVGAVVQASVQARRAKRRRATRDEAAWNEGLACFTARRDAWTGARTVRLKPRPPVSPRSPASPRRSLWRFRSRDGSHGHNDAVVLSSPTATTATSPGTATASPLPLSPASPMSSSTLPPRNSLHLHRTNTGGVDTITPPTSDGDSHTSAKSPAAATAPLQTTTTATAGPATATAPISPLISTYPVETVVPIPAPLLPPANAMRASITPAIYLSIYDKVVSHSLQPSCPINLADMMRSCVAGWKRDGEWPPRSTMLAAPPPPVLPMTPIVDFGSTAAAVAGPFVSSASVATAVRSRRRREREEEFEEARRRREHRDGAAAAFATSSAVVAAAAGAGVGVSAVGNPGGGGGGGGGGVVPRRLSFAGLIGRVASNDSNSNEDGTTPSSPKGIRKSIQRVLGLGQHNHGHGHGHGHSQSVGSVGSPPPQ